MKNNNWKALSTRIILSALGLIIGLFVGTNLGGNYFPDFEFLGGRGYEAAGYLGAIIGSIAGMLLGVYLNIKRSRKNNLN